MHQVQHWQLWLTDIGRPIDGSFEKVHELEGQDTSYVLFLTSMPLYLCMRFKLLLLQPLQNLCVLRPEISQVLMGRALKG